MKGEKMGIYRTNGEKGKIYRKGEKLKRKEATERKRKDWGNE